MDKPKYHDRLSKEQLEDILPRVVVNSDNKVSFQAVVPKVYTYLLDGSPCVVYCINGSFHVFREVEAKQAAEDCGVADAKQMQSNKAWKQLWDSSTL